MKTDHNLERRVTRLENDREAIYDLVSEIRTTVVRHDKRLTKVETTLDQHTQRFDRVDERLDRLDGRLDLVNDSLVELLRRTPER